MNILGHDLVAAFCLPKPKNGGSLVMNGHRKSCLQNPFWEPFICGHS